MATLLDLLDPKFLLGGGLALGGSLLGREPGEALEARQALRNQFNAPFSALLPDFSRTGIDFLTGQVRAPIDPFAPGGIYERFLPQLEREEARSLKGLQDIYAAAFPANVGIQGATTAALRRASGEFAQNRQALVANLLREQQTRQQQAAGALLQYGQILPELQQRAARNVLEFSRPDPTAQAIANLGTILMIDRLLNRQGGSLGALGGLTGNANLDAILRQAGLGGGGGFGGLGGGGLGLGGGGGLGLGGGAGNLAQMLLTTAGQQALARFSPELAGSLLPQGPGGPVAVDLLSSIVQQPFLGQFVFTSPTGAKAIVSPGEAALLRAAGIGKVSTDFGLAGPGLLGPAGFGSTGALLSGLGSGAGGFLLGRELGGRVGFGQDSQALGALTGAGTGAATGFAVGGPPGALLGGVAGALGGFGGTRSRQRAQKAQFRSQDIDSQRDQVFEIGNIGATFLAELGIDQAGMDSWRARVDHLAATSESPEAEQDILASELGNRIRALTGKSPSQIPGLRNRFIDFLIANTFTAGNSSFGGGAPRDLISIWASQAGLRRGGYALRPTLALVGEEGPELAFLAPGSRVMPLNN